MTIISYNNIIVIVCFYYNLYHKTKVFAMITLVNDGMVFIF